MANERGQAEGQEANFLVRTQLKSNPDSFEACVREAFLLEHACQTLEDIGVIVGVDKTQVHHYFKHPEAIQPRTVKQLLEPLQSDRSRRRIVRSWALAGTGVDAAKPARGSSLSREPDESILKRIDKQISTRRLDAAATLSFEAAQAAANVELREKFLDRSYYARLRLNLPGRAMGIIKMIAEGAEERCEPWRLAVAFTRTARVFTTMLDSKPEEVEQALLRASELLQSPPPTRKPRYSIASPELVTEIGNAAYLTYVERGVQSADRKRLEEMLAFYTEFDPSAQRRGFDPFSDNIMAARVHTLLGESFAALERVDKAFAAGRGKVHNCREICAHVQTRILRGSEASEEVIKRYWILTDMYSRELNLQHRLMAEHDLAREYAQGLLQR